MELCICLVPILVVLLGMIFISGLGISNIRALIQAKGNAELLSRTSNIAGGAGESIFSWDYGNTEENGDGYPFTADDKTVSFTEANDAESGSGTLMDLQLNMVQGSESLTENDNSHYTFMPISSLPGANDNFAQDIPETMLAAANLVEGTANNNLNKVSTLTSNDSLSSDEIKSFNLSFTHLFGIDISNIDLQNMRANTVYYPVLPPAE